MERCDVNGCPFCNTTAFDRLAEFGVYMPFEFFGDKGGEVYISPDNSPIAKQQHLIITKKHHLSF